MITLWLTRAFYFLVAGTSAPPLSILFIYHHPLPEKQKVHYLIALDLRAATLLPQPQSHWTWPVTVSYPTDKRGECQHVIPLHVFSTVLVAPSSTKAKASPHIALTVTFYQLHAGRSDLTRDKIWTKEVSLNVKLMRSFIKVSSIQVLPTSFLVHA